MPLAAERSTLSGGANGPQYGMLAPVCQAWGFMAPLASDLGERIKALRVFLGETQEVFAERWARRPKQIGQWENGKQLPTLRAISKAARDNDWPIAMFEEGGPMPAEALTRPAKGHNVREAAAAGYTSSNAAAAYYSDIRAMLVSRASGQVNADVMLDAWDGLWRRVGGATPASGDPVDGEDAADVRRAAALRQAEAQHRLQRGG